MSEEVKAVLAEPWFADTVRAIVAEFYLNSPVRQAVVRRKKRCDPDSVIHYGRYSLTYEPSINTIYLMG